MIRVSIIVRTCAGLGPGEAVQCGQTEDDGLGGGGGGVESWVQLCRAAVQGVLYRYRVYRVFSISVQCTAAPESEPGGRGQSGDSRRSQQSCRGSLHSGTGQTTTSTTNIFAIYTKYFYSNKKTF